MRLLAWLTEVFINTFGITRPRPEQERRAQLLIGGFVLVFAVVAVSIVVFFFVEIRGGH